MAHKILIVDDEDDIIVFLETLFTKEGYEVVTARNGAEAIEAVKKHKPDLVTLDLQMPKNTGTDFFRKMRREKEYENIPIIVISGLPGRHLALPQPTAVFEKPINPDELIETVRKTLA